MADMDSDGWPPAARNAAIREMRKAFALHICGDQHLASTIKYGVEAWGDSGIRPLRSGHLQSLAAALVPQDARDSTASRAIRAMPAITRTPSATG